MEKTNMTNAGREKNAPESTVGPADTDPFALPPAPITAVLERHAAQGKEAELKTAMAALAEFASRFHGYLGMEAEPLEGAETGAYRFTLRWSGAAGLEQMKGSPELTAIVDRINAASRDAPEVREVRGIETWFSIAAQKNAPTPPAWKLMIVGGLAIYPIISVAPGLFAPVTKHLPMWLSNIVLIVVLTPVANYVTTPIFTRLLSGWLYPKSTRQGKQRT